MIEQAEESLIAKIERNNCLLEKGKLRVEEMQQRIMEAEASSDWPLVVRSIAIKERLEAAIGRREAMKLTFEAQMTFGLLSPDISQNPNIELEVKNSSILVDNLPVPTMVSLTPLDADAQSPELKDSQFLEEAFREYREAVTINEPVPTYIEEELVAKAVSGDEQAFTDLYNHHYPRIFRQVYFRVDRMQDAEDLTQQVFINAWRSIGHYEQTQSPFIAWLLVISHNASVNFYRKINRQSFLEDLDRAEPLEMEGIEDSVEARVESDKIRALFPLLRPEYQQVLSLRFLEDLAHKDIAAALGKSEANVRVIQHRAIVELRKLLGTT